MGTSDGKENNVDDMLKDPGSSSKGEKQFNGGMHMDIDIDDYMDKPSVKDLGEDSLKSFCKKESAVLFERYGLISHQINSYNDFTRTGMQNVLNSISEIIVEPGFDPSKKGDGEWKYASTKFGKLNLERPRFWTRDKFTADNRVEFIDLSPKHPRLPNMTYSSRIKVHVDVQIYSQELSGSDKFKTGKEKYVKRSIVSEDSRDLIYGRIPVMVKSDLCWMSEKEDSNCDYRGYFLIKIAEKTFIAQKQICLRRLWVSKSPTWSVACRDIMKRRKVETPSLEQISGGEKVLNCEFLSHGDTNVDSIFRP